MNPRVYFGHIRQIFENSGSTPTADLCMNINSALRDDPLPDNFSFPLADESFTSIIGPKSTIWGGLSTLEASDFTAISNGVKYFYVWGLIRYNDIFEKSPEHITTFCRQLIEVTGNPMNPTDKENPISLFFSIHKRYNATD